MALAPLVYEPLPEADVGLLARVDDATEMMRLGRELATVQDPDRRRSVLADGLVRVSAQDVPDEETEALREMFRDHADVILDPRLTQAAKAPPYVDELAALQVPVLVVAAGENRVASAISKALADRVPQGELVLLSTSQTSYPWLARPDAAADAVLAFLTRVFGPA